MSNPYAPSVNPSVVPQWRLQLAIDLGRFALLGLIWLVVVYAVSLPASKMLTKDIVLIAASPFIPIGLLATIMVGETIWSSVITIFACPMVISFVVAILGVRKTRAWVAAIVMGIAYGLLLRLFYLLCDIA